MKKIVIFIMILSFVFIGTLSAQGNLGFGVKGGLNMAKFTGDGVKEITEEGYDEKYVTAFSLGGFLALPLGNTLTIRPEVLYTQNGAKYEASRGGAEAKMSMKMNWLNIPVLAVFNLQPNIRLFAGPYFDFFLNGKTKVEMSYEEFSFDEEEDIESDEIQSLNYGVIFGAAYGVTNNIGNTTVFTANFSDGTNIWYLRAVDEAGNIGDWAATNYIIVDTSIPTIMFVYSLSKTITFEPSSTVAIADNV